ncbi:MAG: tRNA (adenosine(37)-N6)-threonylcarbamoyltransferase complex dimerization subunit type 1 TsaB, partial [Clostridia bacterium]
MNILGVDTTGKLASVIVKYLDKTIYNEDINNVTHSEKLLSLIDKTLNNINLKDINLLATTIGPGSFTGVRISVSTIKAMAQALNLKIVAIPSLELMAYSYYLNNNSKYICSMLDARNDRVYYSIYEITENNNKIDIIKKCDISNDIFDNVLNKINIYNNITVICDNILPFKDRLNNIHC